METGMSYQFFCNPASLSAALLLLLFAVPVVSEAEPEADLTEKKVIQAIEVRRETQEKEDAWARTKSKLTPS